MTGKGDKQLLEIVRQENRYLESEYQQIFIQINRCEMKQNDLESNILANESKSTSQYSLLKRSEAKIEQLISENCKIKGLEKENKRLLVQFDRLCNQSKNLETKLAVQNNQYEELYRSYEEKTSEISKLETQCFSLKVIKEELVENKQQLEDDLKKLERVIFKMNETARLNSKSKLLLENRYRELLESKQKLKLSHYDLQLKFDEIQTQTKISSKENKTEVSKLEKKHQQHLNDLQNVINIQKSTFKLQNLEVETLKTKLKQAMADIEFLQKNLSTKEAEYNTLKNDLSHSIEKGVQLCEVNNRIRDELSQLKLTNANLCLKQSFQSKPKPQSADKPSNMICFQKPYKLVEKKVKEENRVTDDSDNAGLVQLVTQFVDLQLNADTNIVAILANNLPIVLHYIPQICTAVSKKNLEKDLIFEFRGNRWADKDFTILRSLFNLLKSSPQCKYFTIDIRNNKTSSACFDILVRLLSEAFTDGDFKICDSKIECTINDQLLVIRV